MTIKKLEINIKKMFLNKIIFAITPDIGHIEKNQISILLNDDIFTHYDILYKQNGDNHFYEIIPYDNFNLDDCLTFQIVHDECKSNRVKIYFCKKFNSKGESCLCIKIEENYEGKCMFYVDNIDETDVCINSDIITISKPIDSEKSKIWTDKRNFNKGEIIDTNIKIVNKEGNTIIDGLYEIEVDSY